MSPATFLKRLIHEKIYCRNVRKLTARCAVFCDVIALVLRCYWERELKETNKQTNSFPTRFTG
jgi:hypothetical protein